MTASDFARGFTRGNVSGEHVEREIEEWTSGAYDLRPLFGAPANELVRVLAFRQMDDRDLGIELSFEADDAHCIRNRLFLRIERITHRFQSAHRGHLTRGIGIHCEDNALCPALDLSHLRLGQRSSSPPRRWRDRTDEPRSRPCNPQR